MKSRDEKSSLFVVFLILLLGSGILFWKAQRATSGSQDESSYSTFDREAQDKVNKHLYLTQQRIELEQRQKEIANQSWAPSLGQSVSPPPQKRLAMEGVDHSVDANELDVAKDLSRDRRQLGFNSARAEAQGQIQDELIAAEHEKKYREQYAQEFVENAKKAGYEVVLDENYVVIKVRRKPAQQDKNKLPQLFPGNSPGAR